LFVLTAPVIAQNGAPSPPFSDNPELTQLFKEDQRVRQPKPLGTDEPKIIGIDVERLASVKEMLARDQIHTQADYLHAALILQHSKLSADYLVAHTLAVLCAAEHDKTCLWLSAATLDRYLQSVDQAQIYGTQYTHFDKPPITQQPYADGVISDTLRKSLGVPPLEEQKKELKNMNERQVHSVRK